MSIQAMSAVFGLPGDVITPTQRLVLLSLANHANKEGKHSFPARATISEETGLATRTVTKAVGELKRMGLIRVAHYPGRDAEHRYQGSFVYNLNIPGLPLAPDARGRGSTHSKTPGTSYQVTEEPKKRRSKSFPQAMSEVLDEMSFDG